jgi:hypothetical protein
MRGKDGCDIERIEIKTRGEIVKKEKRRDGLFL